MKKCMLLHFGFEPPSQEIMEQWNGWFQSIEARSVENAGFHGAALEISGRGVVDLPVAADSITGYSIITAANIEDAQAVAQANPFVKSIRVYEIM